MSDETKKPTPNNDADPVPAEDSGDTSFLNSIKFADNDEVDISEVDQFFGRLSDYDELMMGATPAEPKSALDGNVQADDPSPDGAALNSAKIIQYDRAKMQGAVSGVDAAALDASQAPASVASTATQPPEQPAEMPDEADSANADETMAAVRKEKEAAKYRNHNAGEIIQVGLLGGLLLRAAQAKQKKANEVSEMNLYTSLKAVESDTNRMQKLSEELKNTMRAKTIARIKDLPPEARAEVIQGMRDDPKYTSIKAEIAAIAENLNGSVDDLVVKARGAKASVDRIDQFLDSQLEKVEKTVREMEKIDDDPAFAERMRQIAESIRNFVERVVNTFAGMLGPSGR